jgi:hypothetical protein
MAGHYPVMRRQWIALHAMKLHKQIAVLSACLAACFVLTITCLNAADSEPPRARMDVLQTVMAPASAGRMLLAVSPLPRIYVPLGLLPIPDINNPTFGMEDGRIAWISEEHVDTLAISYAEKQPEAWPQVESDWAGQWVVLEMRYMR